MLLTNYVVVAKQMQMQMQKQNELWT
jgi:hypothetical protein